MNRRIDLGPLGLVSPWTVLMAVILMLAAFSLAVSVSGCQDLSRDQQYAAALSTEKAALTTLEVGLRAGVFSQQEKELIGNLVQAARLSREKMAAALLDPSCEYPLVYLDALDIIVGELAAWGAKGQVRLAEKGEE